MNTDFRRYNILRALFLTGIMSDPTLAHARISATGKPTAHSISGQRNGAPMAAGGVGPNPQSLYANDTAVTATPPRGCYLSHAIVTTAPLARRPRRVPRGRSTSAWIAAKGRRAYERVMAYLRDYAEAHHSPLGHYIANDGG